MSYCSLLCYNIRSHKSIPEENMPKISAVMALYNTPFKYLKVTVESILNQSFDDFEFIIIDDASTIEYGDFFKEFNDERIKYFKLKKNSGPGHARNIGLQKATGEYFANVDSDDVYMPQRFKLQAKFLDENKDISLIGGAYCFSNKTQKEIVIEEDKQIKSFMLFNSPFANPLVMFRKNVFLEKNLIYPEDKIFAEDYELWINAMFAGIKMANLTEVLMTYTRRKNQLSKLKSKNQDYILKSIYQKIFLNMGLSTSDSEIALHYNINLENFNDINSKKDIENWFNKIIEKNREIDIFDENALIKKREDTLNQFHHSWWNYKKYLHKPKASINCNIGENKPKTQPVISAVMALYNTPYDIFKKTVSSILNQTFQDFELIIVDDASSLEYEDFLEKFNDSRIKYLKLEKNAGPGYARNIGIKEAQGEYVAIVDSDDIYMNDKFKKQVNFLNKNPDISLVSGAFKFSNKRRIPPIIEAPEDIKIHLLFNSAITNAAVMFRKTEFLEENLFYPEDINFGEDYLLWIDAMFAGVKMTNLKDILMIYVRRKNQLSKSKKEDQVNILKNIYKSIFERLGIDATQEELDLHYKIYCKNFNKDTNEKDIEIWLDKIIECNKTKQIFDESKLIDEKKKIVFKLNEIKNRIFKLKIADYDICIYKPLTIKIEKRD